MWWIYRFICGFNEALREVVSYRPLHLKITVCFRIYRRECVRLHCRIYLNTNGGIGPLFIIKTLVSTTFRVLRMRCM